MINAPFLRGSVLIAHVGAVDRIPPQVEGEGKNNKGLDWLLLPGVFNFCQVILTPFHGDGMEMYFHADITITINHAYYQNVLSCYC